MSAKFALGLTLLLASFAVLAKQPYVDIEQRLTAEQLHATGLDQLSSEQLQLLNGLLREDVVKAVEASKTEAETERASSSSLIGLNDQPIRSRVKGSVGGWEPGTVFELENGHFSERLQSAEVKEAITAFFEKRKPDFSGRG